MLYNINIIISLDILVVMKRIFTRTVLIMVLLTLIIPSGVFSASRTASSQSSNQYKEGFRFNVQGWIYVHVQGDAYERGYQHGYLLSVEIVDMLNRWSNIIHNSPVIKSISKHQSDATYEQLARTWWNFCTKECYRLYWDKFPEEYQQEIQGIASGVTAQGGKVFGRNVKFQDILTLNEMYEFLSKLTKIPEGIHPLQTLFKQLQQVVPEISHVNAMTLLETYLRQTSAHHCNGFIASGNATSHGQLVFSQSTICDGLVWWWTNYITLRWNVLLDIQPSNGHRIIMSTSPGLIWSDEDYYQNDDGLLLLETTISQGPFDNKGLPLSVRARNAIQCGDSIDDMLFSLRYRNDGAMNAVWLLGDTKTGEIARFELGYRHSAVWRTYNGFYWSANLPRDFRVRLEQVNVKNFLDGVLLHLLGVPGWGYFSIRYIPQVRDLKLQELGNTYYGHIDIDIVKQIMATHPIGDSITDIKATDSELMKQIGIWAFFGNPYHSLNISDLSNPMVTNQEVPPAGWVRIFCIPSKQGFVLPRQIKEPTLENTTVLWEFETGDTVNTFTSSSAVEKDRVFETTSEGVLSSLNAATGSLQWQVSLGANPTAPVSHEGLIFVGDAEGLSEFSDIGQRLWKVPTDGPIVSNPVVVGENVLCADSTGKVYELALANGIEQWRLNLSNVSYLSTTYDENIYLTAGESCYAVNRLNHTIVWDFPTQGPITSAPFFTNGAVYVASWDTYVYCIDAKTAKTKWRYQTGWGTDISPLVSQGMVFVASMDNNLYGLTEDGIMKWMFSCQSGIHSTPCAYGNYVFFGSDDGRVYAVNQSSGEALWSFAPGYTVDGVTNYAVTPITSDPIVVNGTVVVGANGTIYGLDAQTVEVPLGSEQRKAESMVPDIPTIFYIFIIIIFVIISGIIYRVFRKKK
jgi:outer membrane protein assembly factor BamB